MTAPRVPASVRKRAEALGDGVLDEGLEQQVRAVAVCEHLATGEHHDGVHAMALAIWAIDGDEPSAKEGGR
jgi:hypothetical protein